MAPAFLTRSTTTSSSAGTNPSYAREPPTVGRSLVNKRSLMPIGTPCSGPTWSPAIRARSDWRASERARSACNVQNASSAPLYRSICSTTAVTTSTGEISRRPINRRSSVADRKHSPTSAIVLLTQRSYRLIGVGDEHAARLVAQEPRAAALLQYYLGRDATSPEH